MLRLVLGLWVGCLAASAQTNVPPAVPVIPPSIDTPAAPAPSSAAIPVDIANDPTQASVVKVFSTALPANPYKPWTKGTPTSVTGSGVVIEGHRILTNAHVVRYGSDFQVQDSQSGDKVSATLETMAPGIDLAVLKLDDDSFFAKHPPLPRAAALPQVRDAVTVYGYPEGGDTLSITKGIVSRVEFVPYNFDVSGLRIQIDAAINAGNSGGAAMVDGKMIGIAFSRLGDSSNIGYIIPSEEIDLFLQETKNGVYQGKPAMYDDLQTMENQALRPFLQVGPEVHGMIVNNPFSSDASYPLKPWDVITKIGDADIDDRGMITQGDFHIRFRYLVQKFAKDGKVPLTIVRKGTPLQVEVPVLTERPALVPFLRGDYPSYFICGPLVFSNATKEFLEDFVPTTKGAAVLNGFIAEENPISSRLMDKPAFAGERLVVVSSPFFPDKLAEGYGDPMVSVVQSINDVPIKNLAHLVQVLRDSKDDFITIRFSGYRRETLVFRRADMLSTTEKVLSNNGIRDQASPDMLSIWNAKTSPAQ